MPFAPVTLFEHRGERYAGIEHSRVPSRFMTITLDCTELMREESPAAVHVDGTARPQIIRREENPGYYAIIEEYSRAVSGWASARRASDAASSPRRSTLK